MTKKVEDWSGGNGADQLIKVGPFKIEDRALIFRHSGLLGAKIITQNSMIGWEAIIAKGAQIEHNWRIDKNKVEYVAMYIRLISIDLRKVIRYHHLKENTSIGANVSRLRRESPVDAREIEVPNHTGKGVFIEHFREGCVEVVGKSQEIRVRGSVAYQHG